MGRALNLIDPVGTVARVSLQLVFCFSIQSSSFPPDLFVTSSPGCSRVCFHVDNVLVFCPAIIFIPGNLAAWDESVWNRSRVGFMEATRWGSATVVLVRSNRRSCRYTVGSGRFSYVCTVGCFLCGGPRKIVNCNSETNRIRTYVCTCQYRTVSVPVPSTNPPLRKPYVFFIGCCCWWCGLLL